MFDTFFVANARTWAWAKDAAGLFITKTVIFMTFVRRRMPRNHQQTVKSVPNEKWERACSSPPPSAPVFWPGEITAAIGNIVIKLLYINISPSRRIVRICTWYASIFYYFYFNGSTDKCSAPQHTSTWAEATHGISVSLRNKCNFVERRKRYRTGFCVLTITVFINLEKSKFSSSRNKLWIFISFVSRCLRSSSRAYHRSRIVSARVCITGG